MSLSSILFVGFGGFLGAILRALISHITAIYLPYFAYGTLIVNSFGSFLIGFIMTLVLAFSLSAHLKYFIVVGILGAFTTFSTFSYENLLYLQNGDYFKFFLNITLNIGLCLLFCYFGTVLTKFFL